MGKVKDATKPDLVESEPTRSKGGRPRALGEEDQGWLRETLRREPSLTISELTVPFAKERGRTVGRSTLGDCLQAMGLTYKKRPRAAGRAEARAQPPHRFNARTRRVTPLMPSGRCSNRSSCPRPASANRRCPALHVSNWLPMALSSQRFPEVDDCRQDLYRWLESGLWDRVNTALRERLRIQEGRNPRPSGGLVDSQAVKTADKGEERGFDAGKKVKGRHRHVLTDTLGLILAIVVHSASIQDRDGVRLLMTPQVKQEYIERTFGWLTNYRRLSKDYEATTDSSRTWVRLAAGTMMLSRLAGQY